MAVGALGRAILVRNLVIVPCRLHPVMLTKRIIAPGQASPRIGVEIAESGIFSSS